MAGKSSATITAEALVVRAAAAYLGFETKVRSPGPASSIPLRPVISLSGDPFSRRRSRAVARAESFMTMWDQSYTRCSADLGDPFALLVRRCSSQYALIESGTTAAKYA